MNEGLIFSVGYDYLDSYNHLFPAGDTNKTPNEEVQKSGNTEPTEASSAEQYSAAEIYESLREFYKGLLF